MDGRSSELSSVTSIGSMISVAIRFQNGDCSNMDSLAPVKFVVDFLSFGGKVVLHES